MAVAEAGALDPSTTTITDSLAVRPALDFVVGLGEGGRGRGAVSSERKLSILEVRERGWWEHEGIRDERTHHWTFIAVLCTLRPASVPIMPTTFETVVLAAVATFPQRCPSCDGYVYAGASRSDAM